MVDSDGSTAGERAPSLGHLTGQVSAERLMADIAEFAKWTKHAGTESERQSLNHVETELRQAGFETTMLLHDAYISIPRDGWVTFDDQRMPAIAHSFSQSSGQAGLTAPLVELEGAVTVAGCAVLIDGIASPGAALAATRAGAVAQIHVSPDEHPHEMCISSVWGSPDDDRRRLLPGTCVVTVAASVGQRIREALRNGAPAEVTVGCTVDTGWRETPILLADLGSPAGDKEEPFVLFSGHHDTWYFGVMDNGGANATMLEVARVCAAHRGAWRRGLRLAFWSGHSQGRYSSSAWYADEHWEELEARAVSHVNVDSTGGKGNTVVSDTTASAELSALADEALRAIANQPFNGRRMQRAGDQSFWGIGVPSIFGNLSEQPPSDAPNPMAGVLGGPRRAGHGTGWWWHTPDDTADKIDADLLVRDTKVYLHVVWRLLSDALLPLDYARAASTMAERLGELNRLAGEHLDLDTLVARSAAVSSGAARMLALGHAHPEEAEAVNEVLRQLSRRLVPIDYTLGDRFAHDPALSAEALPALSDVARLAQLDPDGEDYRFLRSRLVRERNRIAVALREAIRALGSFSSRGCER